MRRTDFSYQLPEELIAQQPLPERSASRLLTLDGASGAVADREIVDLPELLQPGDLLVFNDTRVIPARLFAHKDTGGRVELLLERPLDGMTALVHARASKPLRPAMLLQSRGGPIRMLEKRGDLWQVELPEAPLAFFERCRHIHLDEIPAQAAHELPRLTVGRDERREDENAVLLQPTRQITRAADVGVAFGPGETSGREHVAHGVSVERFDSPAALRQFRRHPGRYRRLARSRQSGKPDHGWLNDGPGLYRALCRE